ncbi:MAG: hypothetical protein OXM56_10375 [Gammaproteobacteria bacterium]|nr:hypothetical protein [Gammaproteobacteria bacterium]
MALLTKLMSGGFGLARTYWLFGLLGYVLAWACTDALGAVLRMNPRFWIGLVVALACVAVFGYALAACVGIWSAARAHTGSTAYAWLARLTSLLGLLGVLAGISLAIVA